MRLHSSRYLFFKCAVAGFSNIDIEIYYVKKLGRRIDSSRKITVLTSNNKRLSGISPILYAVNRKQIPLCFFSSFEFEVGNYNPLNNDLFKKIFNVDCSELILKKFSWINNFNLILWYTF